MTYVSAYDSNDKIVEGKLFVTPTGSKVVLHEGGHTDVDSLRFVRFIEDNNQEDAVDKKVTDDVSHLNTDTLKNAKESDIEQAGKEREKELKDAGMKMEDDEYATKFAIQVANKVSEVDQGIDPQAASMENSKALKTFESEEVVSDLPKDYQDVMPYEDSQSRDEIYNNLAKENDGMQEQKVRFTDLFTIPEKQTLDFEKIYQESKK